MDRSRREGLWKVLVGGIAAAIAGVVGVPVVGAFIAPTRRRSVGKAPHAKASLAALAVETPRKIEVIEARTDAWDRSDPKPIGAAWLVRRAEGRVDAFSTVCPHLGCPVGYDAQAEVFVCPCHDSGFSRADGARLKGPSPRGLDPLAVTVQGDVVDVTYERFVQGIAERKEA